MLCKRDKNQCDMRFSLTLTKIVNDNDAVEDTMQCKCRFAQGESKCDSDGTLKMPFCEMMVSEDTFKLIEKVDKLQSSLESTIKWIYEGTPIKIESTPVKAEKAIDITTKTMDISWVKNWNDFNKLLDQCEDPIEIDIRKSRLRSVISKMRGQQFKNQYQDDWNRAYTAVKEQLHSYFE